MPGCCVTTTSSAGPRASRSRRRAARGLLVPPADVVGVRARDAPARAGSSTRETSGRSSCSATSSPGARVLESGVGSGALTTTLLRAVGPTGQIFGYELRDDFAARARRNVEGFLGPDVPLTIEVRDVYEGIDEKELDRVVLDLPEPLAGGAPRSGGAPTRGHPRLLPADDRAGVAPTGGARRVALRPRAVAGGAPPDVAHRGPIGPTGSPDVGAHRIPHTSKVARR